MRATGTSPDRRRRARPPAGETPALQPATSIYHGLTISALRRVSAGLYLRLAYTWAEAFDNVQDALVAGSPGDVQNSYHPKADWGRSVTDQRHRLAASWL